MPVADVTKGGQKAGRRGAASLPCAWTELPAPQPCFTRKLRGQSLKHNLWLAWATLVARL